MSRFSAKLLALPYQLRRLLSHPANRQNRIGALKRWASWQISARLAPGPIATPFVDGARLLISPGLAGATGNVYFGLAEYEDMAFALHLLRPGDLFVDIGANVGAYSMLAAAAGARVIAFEPIEMTASMFADNVRLNDFAGRVELRRVALGAKVGEATMTQTLDAMNRVTDAGDGQARVSMQTLDDALADHAPTLIKIDVEGYEPEVLRGASKTLLHPSLLAVIVEINGSGERYGFDRDSVETPLGEAGFSPFCYEPRRRVLTPGADGHDNVIFVRDVGAVRARLDSARRFKTLAGDI